MNISRRNLNFLLPVLAATAKVQGEPVQKLAMKVYHDNQIPYKGDQQKKARQFFNGSEHSGFHLEAHETVLGVDVETHAPHKHEHEEIMILVQGTLEAYLDGKKEPVEAGSILYFGSNQMHSVRNIGKTSARYYVIELRGKDA